MSGYIARSAVVQQQQQQKPAEAESAASASRETPRTVLLPDSASGSLLYEPFYPPQYAVGPPPLDPSTSSLLARRIAAPSVPGTPIPLTTATAIPTLASPKLQAKPAQKETPPVPDVSTLLDELSSPKPKSVPFRIPTPPGGCPRIAPDWGIHSYSQYVRGHPHQKPKNLTISKLDFRFNAISPPVNSAHFVLLHNGLVLTVTSRTSSHQPHFTPEDRENYNFCTALHDVWITLLVARRKDDPNEEEHVYVLLDAFAAAYSRYREHWKAGEVAMLVAAWRKMKEMVMNPHSAAIERINWPLFVVGHFGILARRWCEDRWPGMLMEKRRHVPWQEFRARMEGVLRVATPKTEEKNREPLDGLERIRWETERDLDL